MTGPIEHLQHRFVKFIPDELESGVIYISMEYKTVTHRCCCGCGEKVVTPLSPAGWELTFNGKSVSLSPSIGGGTCNSHYFIRNGRVQWARPLTKAQRATALRRDQSAADRFHTGLAPVVDDIEQAPPQTVGWWRRMWRRVSGDQ
jgi:hypothetical protein